ncbi:hypothetical protein [Acidocella sp.]|uniref:hypothetical protein n=1 Tax=Acidocella sp. TaxID=50710 RepID=UPI002627234D|nr:hypothetical protein [Acidocella sp.]
MKVIAGVVVLIVALFFIVPMVAGGSTNMCKALEQHNVRNTASNIAGGSSGPVYGVINTIGQAGATGQMEAAKQSAQNPNTPTFVSCAAAYWGTL